MSEHLRKVHHDKSNDAPKQSTPAKAEAGAQSITNPFQLTPAKIMQLQQILGNQSVQGLIQRMYNNSSPVMQLGGKGTPTATAPVTAPPAPVVPQITPQQQRKLDLVAERESKASILANQAYGEIAQQVEQNVVSFLSTDKKTLGVRQSIIKQATAGVEANIDADATATPKQKEDAKKFAAQQAEASDALKTTLTGYAKEVVQVQVTDSKKGELEGKAREGFNTVVPIAKVALEVQKAKAGSEAQKMVNTFAKRIITDATTLGKADVVGKVKADSSFLDTKVSVGDTGKEEIGKRQTLDDKLISNADIDEVYNKVLFEPIKKSVVLKFGVGRRGIRRSKELNAFRQKLKDNAREQARADIDTQVAADTTNQNGEMTKQYQAMVAKTKAHAAAKVSVDSVMETEAEGIVKQVIPDDSTKEELRLAGKTSAYTVARSNALETGKIKTAGVTAAKVKAAAIHKEKEKIAVNEARKITKGDKQAELQVPDAAKNTAITSGVRTQVSNDDVAGKAIKESLESDNLNSGFSKLGKLIDLSTPNAGDSTSIDVELKIPISSGGGYFLFGFGGEAEREADELSVNSQLTFGAGFQTFGFDANFRLGLFLEAKGKESTNVMNLLSYGLYREMRSKAPSGADYFWGQGGLSGESKLVEAEKWALMIEERDMGEESYVDVGMLTKLAMEGNVGVAEFSGELAYKKLSRYSKGIIDKNDKDTSGNKLTPAARAAKIGKGEIRNVFDAATEVKVKFGKDSVAFGLEGSMTVVGGRVRELSLEASGSVPSQYGEESGEFTKIASKIAAACVGSGKNLIGLLQKLKKDEKDKGTRAAGTLLDAGSDALFLDHRFDSVGASLAEQIKGDSTVNDTMRSWLPGQKAGASAIEQVNKIGLSNSLKLALSFNKEWDESGVGKDWEIALSASQVKSMEVDAGIVKAAVEKSKRIGKIGLSKKGVTGGLAGLEHNPE